MFGGVTFVYVYYFLNSMCFTLHAAVDTAEVEC